MPSPYNIDEIINPGDPGQVQWGRDVAAAVNDLDDRVIAVEGSSGGAWDYGLWPRVVYEGSWPTRATSIPPGYDGNVEYFSPFAAGAPAPTDRITGDIWTRAAQ